MNYVLEGVLLPVVVDGELGSDPEDAVLVGGQGRPGDVDGVRDLGSGNAANTKGTFLEGLNFPPRMISK